MRIRRASLGIVILIAGLIAALCTIPFIPHRSGIDHVDATVPTQGASTVH
ncbi:MAG TPA: hypothetical protein VM468_02470 [Mycoplana sp.]|nr:hypothetical protein [Mycoplana sp.]